MKYLMLWVGQNLKARRGGYLRDNLKVSLCCLRCIVDDVISATALVEKNEKKQVQVAQRIARFLSDTYDQGKEPSFYITEVHRILKHISGEEIPFRDKRSNSNTLGMEIAERLVLPESDKERFVFLVKAAISANHIDYRTAGAGYEISSEETEDMLHLEMKKGLAIDETERIFNVVRSARKILYICDNVGEIAIDRLLISEMQRYANVMAAVRGGPITSDATVEDARFVELDKTCPLIIAGPDTLGISFYEMSAELRDAIKNADLIVTKGQANFYVMEEHRGEIDAAIACLFSTKCDYVSSYFGLSGKINVAFVLKDKN